MRCTAAVGFCEVIQYATRIWYRSWQGMILEGERKGEEKKFYEENW
jgi:hypothetical protein